MNEQIINALIVAIPPTLVALLAWRQAVKTGNVTREQATETRKEVKEVHILINNRMDQLLKSEKSVSKAEGKVEERAEEIERNLNK